MGGTSDKENVRMIKVEIHSQACRGCQICVDLCPTKVFSYDFEQYQAMVMHEEDCIGCLSCAFLCPSGAIRHEELDLVPNFYHDLDFCSKMEKFL
jgi:NAD-dependent dihydropyrimidine dehydrogenase PreA subunit